MKQHGQGATEYLLLLAAVLIIVAIVVYCVTLPYKEVLSDTDILQALKDGERPLSDKELQSTLKCPNDKPDCSNHVWPTSELVHYYQILDRLVAENYIGMETIHTYTLYYITEEGMFYLWSEC